MFGSPALAQKANPESVLPLLSETEQQMEIVKSEFFTINSVDIDLLDSSKSLRKSYDFSNTKTYRIVVVGQSNKVGSFKVQMINKAGQIENGLVLENTDDSADHILTATFEPSRTSTYEIELLSELSPDVEVAHCGLIIASF